MEKRQVNPNITIYYIPMEKLKTTTLGMYVRRPMVAAETSLNAVLPHVLKRGCRMAADSVQVAQTLEGLYGASLNVAVTKKGENQMMVFDTETIADRYAPAGEALSGEMTELLFSMLLEPVLENGVFRREFVEQEKKNAKDRIESLINDKRSYAHHRCVEEMCKGEPFGLSALGTAAGVDQITPENLYAHYQTIITSSVIDIFVCGTANLDQIAETIQKKLGGISFLAPPAVNTEILQKNTDLQRVTEQMDVTQGKLSIGFRTNIRPDDPDAWALTVGNSVFGAGTHSKLFNNVREKLSLAYYASSQLEKMKGLMVVNAGIEFANFQKAYDETMAQFQAIQAGEVTDMEFDSSIKTIINSLNSYYDNQRYMRAFYLDQMLAGTNCDIEGYKRNISAVTKDDVIRAFQKIQPDTVYFLTGKEEA